jgi:hypothetical protein
MSNTVDTATLIDDQRRLVLQINITGDGSGELTGAVLVDPANYANTTQPWTYPAKPLEFRIEYCHHSLVGFSAALIWDATTAVQALVMPANFTYEYDGCRYSGIRNDAGAGKTGKILITTSGLSTAGGKGTIILELLKRWQ